MEAHHNTHHGVGLTAVYRPKLTILDIPGKGRGVVALSEFEPGDVIEDCPVLVISGEDSCHIDQTSLYNYYWEWKGDAVALALGYGSLYNHSDMPNARVMKNYETSTMKILCMKSIKPGEEISVHYGSVWFKMV